MTHPLKLPAQQQDLEVQHWSIALGVEMTLSKFDKHFAQVPEAILFVRRLAGSFRLANEAQLEPQPVFGRGRHAGHVATIDLDAANQLVQGMLVGVGRVGEVANTLIVLGQETVTKEFWQAARRSVSQPTSSIARDLTPSLPTIRTVEPCFQIRHEALLELLNMRLILSRERERFI